MLYGPWQVIEPPRVRVGSAVKRRGETLTWDVIGIDDIEVTLVGPGRCYGLFVIARDDFNKDWERA
jgi:hypothetical protein